MQKRFTTVGSSYEASCARDEFMVRSDDWMTTKTAAQDHAYRHPGHRVVVTREDTIVSSGVGRRW